jgi:tetratricopeptide (TPR) repeat protein
MRVLSILAAVMAAASALGQALLCPPPAKPACDTFHFHVRMYRPDTRGFIEFSGINRFATKSDCERARDAAAQHDAAVVDFFRTKRRDAKYEPDELGPCHCDTSDEYLNDVARNAQLRLHGEVLMRIRERMLPEVLPPPFARLASPFGDAKVVRPPDGPPPYLAADLKMTKVAEGEPAASLDLPLMEFGAAAAQPDDDFAKVDRLFAAKDFGGAYAQLARIERDQPDAPALLYDMALTLAKAGRFTEAQSRLDRYAQLYPDGAEKPLAAKLRVELDFQREMQKKREVEQQYAELFSRGRFLYERGELDAALRLFQDAEQQHPNDPAAAFNQAVILENRGDAAKAEERFHRYAELSGETMERHVDDLKTKLLCPFCGLRLAAGATWCPRCWHLARNAPRYSPARQRQIEEARKSEGWTYDGEILTGRGLMQGPDYLVRAGVAAYEAHNAGGVWLLDREELVLDGLVYAVRYTFDAENRIAREDATYVNDAACHHLIAMSWDGTAIKGGYDGFAAEGAPHVEWVLLNDSVPSIIKEYTQKPFGALREEIAALYPNMRIKQPMKVANDFCAAGLENKIDVRPFYAVGKQYGSSSGQSASSN